MTDAQVAHTLAHRLIPTDAAHADELAAKLARRPELIAQARNDMDAAERAMVREARVYLRSYADALTKAVRNHHPPKRAA